MALIKCPKCGKDISANSISCFYCGVKIGAVEENKDIKVEDLTDSIKESETSNNSRTAMIILISTVAFFIMLAVGIQIITNMYNVEEPSKESQITNVCQSNGLKDIVLNTEGYDSEFHLSEFSIDSSNFSDLSTEKMFALDEALDNISGIYITGYACNGDKYNVDSGSLNITKNEEEIYDDYYNSKYYLDVQDTQDNDSYSSSSTASTSSNTYEPSDEEKGYAIAVAKQEVKNNLKSPSSADFPWGYDEYSITKTVDNKYTVSSYVDAENSYGAEIRTYYTVDFTKTGEETYILDNVYIQE